MVDAPRLALPAVAGAGVAAAPDVAVVAGCEVEVEEAWPAVEPRLKAGAAVAAVGGSEAAELWAGVAPPGLKRLGVAEVDAASVAWLAPVEAGVSAGLLNRPNPPEVAGV